MWYHIKNLFNKSLGVAQSPRNGETLSGRNELPLGVDPLSYFNTDSQYITSNTEFKVAFTCPGGQCQISIVYKYSTPAEYIYPPIIIDSLRITPD